MKRRLAVLVIGMMVFGFTAFAQAQTSILATYSGPLKFVTPTAYGTAAATIKITSQKGNLFRGVATIQGQGTNLAFTGQMVGQTLRIAGDDVCVDGSLDATQTKLNLTIRIIGMPPTVMTGVLIKR